MKEILPGVHHWTVVHPKIGIPVSSYYLAGAKTLIDPLIPEAGIDAIDPAPEQVILTNRHHYRDAGKFAKRYGCAVRCVDQGLHEFTAGEAVEPFRFGDELPGGILAVEIGGICPDETALLIRESGGIAAMADGVVRHGDGPLGFVPDQYMGEDPESVKGRLRDAYRRFLEHEFDHVLLAHGDPWIGGGKEALREFVGG